MARPALPTAILRARGSWRADNDAHKREPKLPAGHPERPKMLSKVAADEWDRIVGQLVSTGVLSELDRGALACLCEAWAEVVASLDALKRNPHGRNNVSRKRFALSEYFKAAAQFGMTPSARSRVQAIEGKDADDKKARFFKAS